MRISGEFDWFLGEFRRFLNLFFWGCGRSLGFDWLLEGNLAGFKGDLTGVGRLCVCVCVWVCNVLETSMKILESASAMIGAVRGKRARVAH